MSSPFSPESQVSKINCHVLFIDLSRDLGPVRFPSRAPLCRGDGDDRQELWQGGGQGSASGAGLPDGPGDAPAVPFPLRSHPARPLPGCASAPFNLSPAASRAWVCSVSFQDLLLS